MNYLTRFEIFDKNWNIIDKIWMIWQNLKTWTIWQVFVKNPQVLEYLTRVQIFDKTWKRIYRSCNIWQNLKFFDKIWKFLTKLEKLNEREREENLNNLTRLEKESTRVEIFDKTWKRILRTWNIWQVLENWIIWQDLKNNH